MILDDKTLLTQYAKSRDAEAFAQLVKRYSSMIFAIAKRVTGSKAIAEDVTQDCFLTLARQADSVKGSLPAWLHKVAFNRSLELTRSENSRQKRQVKFSAFSRPENETKWSEITPLIDEAIEELPDEFRQPLVQHFLLGQTQKEIADSLNVNQATISRRIQEGIEKLRQILKKGGFVCSVAVITGILTQDALAQVPVGLKIALAKMAMAGPAKIGAAVSLTALLSENMKLIIAVALTISAGALLTYQIAPVIHSETTYENLTPRAYLSGLEFAKTNSFTRDTFAVAFAIAAKKLGVQTDYDTIYAISTNSFCPSIDDSAGIAKSFWNMPASLGDKGIQALSAHYGLNAKNLDIDDFKGDDKAYRKKIVPSIISEMDKGNIIIAAGGWKYGIPCSGIIAGAQGDGTIFGFKTNDGSVCELVRPEGLWSLSIGNAASSSHQADMAALDMAVKRIRGEGPFGRISQISYGLEAMDVWINTMSQTPCAYARVLHENKDINTWACAYLTAKQTQTASIITAKYLRQIAPKFCAASEQALLAGAAHYDRIAALLSPGINETGPDSYSQILGDMPKQKEHSEKVLVKIKSEYAAIADDIETALKNEKR